MSAFSLSATDVGHLRTVVDLCATRPEQAAEAVWPVLEELQALVGCQGVYFNGMDPLTRTHYHCQGWASGATYLSTARQVDEADDPFWTYYPQCAPCSYPDRVKGRAVVSHDDFCSLADWLAHPMHVVVHPEEFDELVVSFPDGSGKTVRLLFPRGPGAMFGDREKLAMRLLAPHLESLLLVARAAPPVQRLPITDRQWQILERVRLGLANKQIAHELELSPATVRKHLENVFRSLDVQSRGAAVHVAFDEADGRSQLGS